MQGHQICRCRHSTPDIQMLETQRNNKTQESKTENSDEQECPGVVLVQLTGDNIQVKSTADSLLLPDTGLS